MKPDDAAHRDQLLDPRVQLGVALLACEHVQHALTEFGLRQCPRCPDSFCVRLNAGLDLQLDGTAADSVERVFMKERRGNEEHRMGEARELDIEVRQEVEQPRIADQGSLFPEIDLQDARSAMETEAFGRLELDCQALPEVPPDMDFEISAIVVRQGTSWNEPPVRGKDADLGELGLGDHALLDVGNGHLQYANRPPAISFLSSKSRPVSGSVPLTG